MITDYAFIICSLLVAIILIMMIAPALHYLNRLPDKCIDPRINTYYPKDDSVQYLKKKHRVMCRDIVYGEFENRQEAFIWAKQHLNLNWYIEEYNQYV